MFKPIAVFSIFASILTVNLPVQAETCIPIHLVGGQGNSVTKTVSPPTIPAGPLGMVGIDIDRNNWNTDWAIPGGSRFSRFIVTITSPDGGPFDIKMYLKYSDQTAGQFYNTEGVKFQPGKPLIIQASPRPEDEPYQVNLLVNGVEALGKTYTATVVGCY